MSVTAVCERCASRSVVIVASAMMVVAALVPANIAEAQAIQITRRVFGGASSSGGVLAIAGSAGQGENGGTSASGSLAVTSGFWAGAASSAKGDFNNDGSVDLVLRNSATSQAEAWIMQGTQRFRRDAYVPSPPVDWEIVGADDFGGDEQTDLVLRNEATGAVAFWILDGTVRVGAPVPLGNAAPPPLNWRMIATADFDRNGWADLLWRNTLSQQLVIWTMNQTNWTGTIVPTPSQAANANWQVVAALDYSGDALVDLLWYNADSGNIVLWFMDSAVVRTSGDFTVPMNATNANWKVVAGGDYGTGAPGLPLGANDIVWRNDSTGNLVVWHMDFQRTRTTGVFTSPPSPESLDWGVVGPR